MKRLYISEARLTASLSGYDHVFSFCENSADSFTQDYVSAREVETFYDDQFYSIIHRIQGSQDKKLFTYRGVDLIWCFKKTLFEFAYYIRHRYETFRRVVNSHALSHFFLAPEKEICDYPSLAKMLPYSPLKDCSEIHFTAKSNCVKQNTNHRKMTNKKKFWPPVVKLGSLKGRTVMIFSDYEKSKVVMEQLHHDVVIIYTNSRSPRTTIRALKNRISLYQAAQDAHSSPENKVQAVKFSERVRNATLFRGLKIGEIHAEALIYEELQRLFRSVLPRLLHEIDQFHDFLKEANDLKSALLDEDVTLSKNAFCQIAKEYDVTTFVESHAALGHQIGSLPLTADKLFVWGARQKNKLMEWGCAEDRILISGCSRYSPYRRLIDAQVREQVAKQFDLNPLENIILVAFISTKINRGYFIFEEQVKRNISTALAAVDKLLSERPSVQVILKVHPGDDRLPFYNAWAKSHAHPDRIVVIEQYNPFILAKAADFLVVYASTYAVDGFALDKQVISIFDGDWRILSEYRAFSVFEYANNRDELHRAMVALLDRKREKPKRWKNAKIECLNQNGTEPEQLIASSITHV